MPEPKTTCVKGVNYPSRKDILIVIRDVLDQKPAATALLKRLLSDLQLSTLTWLVAVINDYVTEQDDKLPHHP